MTWDKVRDNVTNARDRYVARLAHARDLQEAMLLRILDANAGCGYGIKHCYSAIQSASEYQQATPIVGYEDIALEIEQSTLSNSPMLSSEPIVAFEETGGSRGGRKLIPYTSMSLTAFQAALTPWLDDMLLSFPRIADGTAYWAVSPAMRKSQQTPSGIPIGLESDAAYLGPDLGNAIAETLAMPATIANVHDLDAWRFFTLAHLLATKNLSFISIWSPSFLLELLRPLANMAYADQLIETIEVGVYSRHRNAAYDARMPPPKAHPARARRLRNILSTRHWTMKEIWPDLALISCWTHATSKIFLPEMENLLADVAIQGKGLIATEGIVTLPLASSPFPVLAVDSGFHEFLASDGRALLCDELSVGETYSVLMTTWGGLYRYRIGDLVRVRGYLGQAPLLEFVGREGCTTDLVGEKLSEEFVLNAVGPLLRGAWVLTPSPGASPHYQLFTEQHNGDADLAASIDRALCANPQYAYARSLGQLDEARAMHCPDLCHRWHLHASKTGRRIGDVKPPVLARVMDADFFKASPA